MFQRSDDLTSFLDDLTLSAIKGVKQDYEANRISHDSMLRLSTDVKKTSLDNLQKQLRLKQEMHGVLTSDVAIEAASLFVDELLLVISNICHRFGVDYEEFQEAIGDEFDRIVRQSILSKADKLAKDRLTDNIYRENKE